MDMLIKHGTWMIVPGGLTLAFLYSRVYAKVYPFLVARSLAREDERKRVVPILRIVVSRKRPPAQAGSRAEAL